MKLKKIKVLLVLAGYASAVYAWQKSDDDFSGKWKVEEGRLVEITKSNGVFNGVGIPEKVQVLKDVKFEKGKWEGTIFNPLNKKQARCELLLQGNDRLKITAKVGTYRQVFFWSRVK